MAQTQTKSDSQALSHGRLFRAMREAALLLSAALMVYLLMTLISYSPADPGWSSSGDTMSRVSNLGGVAGAWSADVLLSLFGAIAFLLPCLLLYAGWCVFRWSYMPASGALNIGVRGIAFIIALLSACALASLHWQTPGFTFPQGTGGIAGSLVGRVLVDGFNPVGTTLLLITLLIVSLPLLFSFSWLLLFDQLGEAVLQGSRAFTSGVQSRLQARREARKLRVRVPVAEPATNAGKGVGARRKRKASKAASRTAQMPLPMPSEMQGIEVPKVKPGKGPVLPPVDMLDPPRHSEHAYSEQELERMSGDLERHLSDFGVQAKVVAAQPGPVITRFELEPAPGVKVSQVSNLAKDLARALSVLSVRVVEIIPGKSVMGLEIPNQNRELVSLSELLLSNEFNQPGSPLTLALGKDIAGTPVSADLSRMPHLLVAGTTGSGKSVAVNAMILSILYKATAEAVRFIMIDPKMLELSVYEGIPHLLAPVVTDMKDAANALRWCVAEMERRYRLMAATGVRNLAGFNRKIREAAESGQPIPDPLAGESSDDTEGEPPTLEPLPCIVVVVDELSDLMMTVGKKVEELIARLAQKARAAGIHLILATQRPSVDVITGLIKANIPTRIAFQVSSRVDSRTILDQMGAESLLGHGDMLYLPPGTAMPLRVHGAFVDDHEVHKVVAFLKQVGEPDYLDEILEGAPETSAALVEDDAETDPLYDQAVSIVTESRKASISYVQRRLRVGYNRAARLVEQMERAGLVGPLQSNGSREVLAGPPPPE